MSFSDSMGVTGRAAHMKNGTFSQQRVLIGNFTSSNGCLGGDFD